jgi:hypothetical protein
MKDSTFIELLNLYIDHQISPAEAERLETEVRSNPERRRVYRQYCQIQKACTSLGEAFRTEAPAPVATPQIIDFKPRRRALGFAAYGATVTALAACVAVVVVLRTRPQSLALPTASVAQVPPAALAVARPALQPVLGPRSLKLREQNAELVEATPAAYQVAFGDWMNDVRLSSMAGVSIDELRFDGRSPAQSELRANRAVRPFQGKVEMAAVRFQK